MYLYIYIYVYYIYIYYIWVLLMLLHQQHVDCSTAEHTGPSRPKHAFQVCSRSASEMSPQQNPKKYAVVLKQMEGFVAGAWDKTGTHKPPSFEILVPEQTDTPTRDQRTRRDKLLHPEHLRAKPRMKPTRWELRKVDFGASPLGVP